MAATRHRGRSGRHPACPVQLRAKERSHRQVPPPATKVSTVITGEGPASPDDVVNAVGRGCRVAGATLLRHGEV
jgi:hypothetical protein